MMNFIRPAEEAKSTVAFRALPLPLNVTGKESGVNGRAQPGPVPGTSRATAQVPPGRSVNLKPPLESAACVWDVPFVEIVTVQPAPLDW